MARLIRTAKKHTVRLLLTQPQFSHHAVNILSSEVKNLVVVNINPLQEDWFSMMNAMKTALEKYLQ